MFNWIIKVLNTYAVDTPDKYFTGEAVSDGESASLIEDFPSFAFGFGIGLVIGILCTIGIVFTVKSIKKSNAQIKERKTRENQTQQNCEAKK